MTNVSKGMEYATTFEREAMREKLDAALGDLEPQKQEWVGLTDDEITQCSYDAEGFMIGREVAMRAVEVKLKEKNE